jgi:hypothetical protein
MPNFRSFIQPYFDRSRRKVTERYMMRGIVEAIANESYNDELYRPNPAYVDFEGVPFKTIEDLEAIIFKILAKYAKNSIHHFLAESVKKIPAGVDVVYFYGTYPDSDPLLKRGFKHLSGEEARAYMFAQEGTEESHEVAVPENMPVDRFPSPEYVDEGTKKKNRKIKGEFKDGTVYNEDMLERVV